MGKSVHSVNSNNSNPTTKKLPHINPPIDIVNTSTSFPHCGLNIMFTNIDMISNKLDEFECFISIHQPKVICLNEILPKSAKEKETYHNFQIPHYTKFQPPVEKSNRGTATFIHESIDAQAEDGLNSYPCFDTIWCVLNIKGEKILIGNVYRNCNNPFEDNYSLNDCISDACDRYRMEDIFILGDFNYKNIDWTNMSTSHLSNHHSSVFLDTVKNNFLHQMITDWTRQRGNDHPSLLYLAFTNNPGCISAVRHFPPIGKSDHDVLQIIVDSDISLPEQSSSSPIYNFFKGNYNAIKCEFSTINWQSELIDKTVDAAWECLKNKLENMLKKHIPLKHSKPQKKNPLWFTNAAKQAIKRRQRTWRKYKSSQTSQLRKLKYDFEHKIANECKVHPKAFWSYVNSRTKSTSLIPELLKPDGSKTSNDS